MFSCSDVEVVLEVGLGLVVAGNNTCSREDSNHDSERKDKHGHSYNRLDDNDHQPKDHREEFLERLVHVETIAQPTTHVKNKK